MRQFFLKLLGNAPWKNEWKDELSEVLHNAQKDLKTNMVVVVARESDIYSEILFIFSFLGLSLGCLLSFLFRGYLNSLEDILLLPMLGFAAGATVYSFRRFFVNRVAPKAVRDRVSQKAKAQFHDHYQHLKQRLALVYLSETEKEALFLTSPDISESIPKDEIQKELSELVVQYKSADPLRSLRPCLLGIGALLKQTDLQKGVLPSQLRSTNPSFITATDQKPGEFHVPILKGSKDIN